MSSYDNDVAPMELDDDDAVPTIKRETRRPIEEEEKKSNRRPTPQTRESDNEEEEEEEEKELRPQSEHEVDENENDDDVDVMIGEDRSDRVRAEEIQQKLKTKHDLKLFNEAMDDPRMSTIFQSNKAQDMLTSAATKLDFISSRIGKKDVSNSLLDAQGFNKLGALGQKQADQLNSTTKIDFDEFMKQFQRKYGVVEEDQQPNEDRERCDIDWYRFGRDLSYRFRGVDCTSFMKGILGLQVAVKERKAAARRKRNDEEDIEAPVTHAEQLRDTTKEALSMTDKRVTLLFSHLPDEWTNFFRVMIHPTSFTQTVENLFDLTFLIKQGQAAVQLDPELAIPVIRRLSAEEISEDVNPEGGMENLHFQCIMKIDMNLWEQLVKAFKLTGKAPFLPDRTQQYKEQDKQAKTIARAKQARALAARPSQLSSPSRSAAPAAAATSTVDGLPHSSSPARHTPQKRRSSSLQPTEEEDDDAVVVGDEDEDITQSQLLPAFASASQPTMRGFVSSKRTKRAAAAATANYQEEGDEEDD